LSDSALWGHLAGGSRVPRDIGILSCLPMGILASIGY
jgi:tetrahydromethanopterin S-methyltransferase subunit G